MSTNPTSVLRVAALSAAALVCFAGNSWLCRAALRTREIDPASFTAIRIAAGAAVLALLVSLRAPAASGRRLGGGVISAFALFAYAIAFSFAYLGLSAGVGALLLFGAVQLTMMTGGLLGGQTASAFDLVGMAMALGGLALLALPGATAPPPLAASGMVAAGVAWGIYSLRGRRETLPPLAVTAGNFAWALPFALATLGVAAPFAPLHASGGGALLATISGALTSGIGYAIWYAALPHLKTVRAGLVQLAVPILTALGGVAFLGERLTPRLLAATALVLGGIAIALASSSLSNRRGRRIGS